jgi:hypothetical protein
MIQVLFFFFIWRLFNQKLFRKSKYKQCGDTAGDPGKISVKNRLKGRLPERNLVLYNPLARFPAGNGFLYF